MKNYIGISRDHSASMQSLAKTAARDYNAVIATIKEEAEGAGQDTIVSVVKCGVNGHQYAGGVGVQREAINSSISVLKPLAESAYDTRGNGTPLWDSIGDLIEQFEAMPDANDSNVCFLVTAITDGEENRSNKWNSSRLMEKMRKLQATDRWTFVFRVPRGYARSLTNIGIPAGNILEWETTTQGLEISTTATREAFRGYYKGIASGTKSTDKFYTNIADLTPKQIKKALVDISTQVNLWSVDKDSAIKPFCEAKLGGSMVKGAAFYQLTKTESEVQDYKQIIIRDKKSGAVYTGGAARDMLGLPHQGMARVAPGDHGNYDVFLQSTSINRKLPAGTQLMYWPYAGITK